MAFEFMNEQDLQKLLQDRYSQQQQQTTQTQPSTSSQAPSPAPQWPGDPNLPGYGDMDTSNPWRDSLSYRQIMDASAMPPFEESFLYRLQQPTQDVNKTHQLSKDYQPWYTMSDTKVDESTGFPVPPSDTTSNQPPATSPAPSSSSTIPLWQGGIPIGFEASKWNDPNYDSMKYDAGHLLASGASQQDILNMLNQKYGSGWTAAGSDSVRAPDGAEFDLWFDEEGIRRPQWTQTKWAGGDSGGGGSRSVSEGSYPLRSVSESMRALTGQSAGSGVGSMGMFGAGSPYLSQLFGGGQAQDLYARLMGIAGQSMDPSAQDPSIANLVNSYSAQRQRAARDYIDDLAESRGPIANLQGEKRLAAEKVGQDVGGFQAELMNRERNARRQQIMQALSGAMGFLTDQQRLALTRELEYLNMSQRAYEFDVNDEFRRSPLAS